MSVGYTVEQDEIVNTLRTLAEAYPIDIFPDANPLVKDEEDRIQRQMGRAAAMIMRHHSSFLLQVAAYIEKLKADLEKSEYARDMNLAYLNELRGVTE